MKLSGLLLCSVLAWPVAYAALRADRPEPQAQVYTAQAAPAPVAPIATKTSEAVEQDRIPRMSDEAKAIYRLRGVAFAAKWNCYLRSQSWFISLENGLLLSQRDALIKQSPMNKSASVGTGKDSPQDHAEFDALQKAQRDFQEQGYLVYDQTRRYFATRCSELVNSPLMDTLDQAQWRTIGGYH